MPAFERDKIERMLRKMFPQLWFSLSEEDVDRHRIECLNLLLGCGNTSGTKILSSMVKRFRRTFE